MARRNGPPREQISAQLRFEVLSRCNFACYYCGVPATLGLKVLHVDHVIPVILGGTNDPWNRVAACWDCNAGKAGNPPPDALVQQVLEDYLATTPRGALETVIICELCRRPHQYAEGEEIYDYCTRCVDRDLLIYNLGLQAGGV